MDLFLRNLVVVLRLVALYLLDDLEVDRLDVLVGVLYFLDDLGEVLCSFLEVLPFLVVVRHVVDLYSCLEALGQVAFSYLVVVLLEPYSFSFPLLLLSKQLQVLRLQLYLLKYYTGTKLINHK